MQLRRNRLMDVGLDRRREEERFAQSGNSLVEVCTLSQRRFGNSAIRIVSSAVIFMSEAFRPRPRQATP